MKMLVIGIAVLVLNACSVHRSSAEENFKKSSKQQEETIQYDKEWITFSRGYCFGKCPVYVITIFKDGSVLYNGKANVNNEGYFHGQLTKEQMASLEKGLTKFKIMDLEEDLVDKMIMDAPVLSLKIVDQKSTKLIQHSGKTPDNLKAFEQEIDQYVNEMDLKKLETDKK